MAVHHRARGAEDYKMSAKIALLMHMFIMFYRTFAVFSY